MPFIETTTPIAVPGIAGSYARVLENQMNAHTPANPQGLQPVFGSGSPFASNRGNNAVGARNGPNTSDANFNGTGTGTAGNGMNPHDISANTNDNPGITPGSGPTLGGCGNCPPCCGDMSGGSGSNVA